MRNLHLFCYSFLVLLLFPFAASAQLQTVGLFTRVPASEDGYVLFAPISSTRTYLIDKCGRRVHDWQSSYQPGLSAYLLEDGSLLRTGNAQNTKFNPGGSGGVVELMDWNGAMLWSYTNSSTTECLHHDVHRMPNGDILVIAWEAKPAQAAINRGREPGKIGPELWPDKIVELRPSGTNGATVVWEWHAWDHMIQDYDAAKPDYGVVADHPELININYNATFTNPDWMHSNGIDYNPETDQILLCARDFNEIWVIDHSTTTAEAASHYGGVSGKGGDLLYRWGNPEAYGRGSAADRTLFEQHDAQWIRQGLKDEGKIMIYNNGVGRPGGDHSSVDIIEPPIDGNGAYILNGTSAYGPASAYWSYSAPVPSDFFAPIISGAQRLSNGNTLICEGTKGKFFEIDSMKNIVWEYINPVDQGTPIVQGTAPVQNFVFRSEQYPISYPGFIGRTLIPGTPLEQNPIPNNCTMGNNSPSAVSNIANKKGAMYAANPFRDKIELRFSEAAKDMRITLTNTIGAVCATWTVSATATEPITLDVPTGLTTGIYVLRATTGQQQVVKQLYHE